MYYDLHIHSCLSPCADDDMTIHNILNMCMLKELELISITDHNSMKQYRYLKEVAKQYAFQLIYGVEVQTMEDVHVCCYFKEEMQMDAFQILLDIWNPGIPNQKEYFGNQILLNAQDEIDAEEERLLVVPLQITLQELCTIVHSLQGAFVLAHALGRSNSICTQLGFIPKELAFDGIEVRSAEEKKQLQIKHPWITDTVWLINSDAHRLIDIQERTQQIAKDKFEQLWRNNV